MSSSNRHYDYVPHVFLLGSSFNNLFSKYKVLLKAFLILLIAANLPLHYAKAQQQTYVMPVDSTLAVYSIINCDSTASFISDTATHTLYADSAPRSDSISICPQSQGQRVKINFDAFDLAAGDTLSAFNGLVPHINNLIGQSSGVGPSVAFGAWVAADCDPTQNVSGCLSFVFKTNGDGIASAGWKAFVHCERRDVQIHLPSITFPALACEESYKIVTIPPALVTATCGSYIDTLQSDTTLVRVYNTEGEICLDTCLSKNQNLSVIDTFAIGTYLIEYKLKKDTSIRQEVIFAINPPALACNDTLNIGVDANCAARITPDILLEATCDSLQDTMYYQITISKIDEVSNKKTILASGTGRNGDFPIITKDMVDFCGESVYKAEITRIYYQNLNLSFCNNGAQSNTCWAFLKFEDKAAPLFVEPVQCDTIYSCDLEMSQAVLGLNAPQVKDNCDSTLVRLANIEEVYPNADCDVIRIYVINWQATDECGNNSYRKDTLKVFRPGKDKIIKAGSIILSCGVDDSTAIYDLNKVGVPSIQIGRQKNGTFIASDTIPLTEYASVCTYNIEKRDVHVKTACNEKIYRYWHLLDWCIKSTVPIPIDTQLIEFRDTIAPVLNCMAHSNLSNAEHISLSTDACEMEVQFPLLSATDNCVKQPFVAEFTVDVLEADGWWSVATSLAEAGALACDTFRVGYRAFDDCHEQLKEDTCYRYFIIEDVTAPTAICEDELNVSLSQGETYLRADAIDGGSWDMCQIDTILARRTVCNDVATYQGDSNTYVLQTLGNSVDPIGWGDVLAFTCCDIHHPVFVELLVIDKKGNFSTCWMNVKAEDKIYPICQPLEADTAYCDEYNDQFLGSETDANENGAFDDSEWIPLVGELADFYNKEFGDPAQACEDNLKCNDLMLEQEYQFIRQSCGEALIKRRYRAIDYGKNHAAWETQNIYLKYRPNWKINFPKDQVGDCNAHIETPAVSPIQNGNCDQLSWDYEDVVFRSANNIFIKILRTYSVVNWCIYQPGDQPIIIHRKEDTKGLVRDSIPLSSDSLANIGYIQYTQVLRVLDEDAPFLLIGKVDTMIIGKGDADPPGEEDQNLGAAPFECDAVRVFQVFARDCNEAISESLLYEWEFYKDDIMMMQGTGDTFSQIVYPGPQYEVKWAVTDVFSNTSLIAEYYQFVDGLAPVAYCHSGVVAETNPAERFARISVDLLDLGSYDNCTDQVNLKKRLWHPVLNIPRPKTAMEVMALPTYLELGCLFIGTQEVSLYVMDEAGNFDYCITNVIVQNNMLACSRRMVAGEIINSKNQPIEDVTINVLSPEHNLSVTSDAEGNFQFTMPDGANYTVRPSLNTNPLNGVSTYDLVLINKHILGIKPFDKSHQFIAADVNRSGTITAFDIVQVRKLILNLIDEFPNNTSWRFIDMNYEMGDDMSALDMPNEQEEQTIHDLSGDRLGTDFLGIKIGDVNGSALPNRTINAGSRNRVETFELITNNQYIEKGKVYTLPFSAEGFQEITGFQFTLEYKHLKLLNIDGGILGLEHFGQIKASENVLTASWHSLQSHEKKADLFALTFEAIKDGYINELLKITSNHTPAEAYRFSGTFMDVVLHFPDPSPIPFSLYQNTPNPFKHQTTISFELPAKGSVLFQLVNSQGQVIQKQENTFDRGLNSITLPLQHLPSGTYYYQIASPFGVKTKKMTKTP